MAPIPCSNHSSARNRLPLQDWISLTAHPRCYPSASSQATSSAIAYASDAMEAAFDLLKLCYEVQYPQPGTQPASLAQQRGTSAAVLAVTQNDIYQARRLLFHVFPYFQKGLQGDARPYKAGLIGMAWSRLTIEAWAQGHELPFKFRLWSVVHRMKPRSFGWQVARSLKASQTTKMASRGQGFQEPLLPLTLTLFSVPQKSQLPESDGSESVREVSGWDDWGDW